MNVNAVRPIGDIYVSCIAPPRTHICTLSLHDALPISAARNVRTPRSVDRSCVPVKCSTTDNVERVSVCDGKHSCEVGRVCVCAPVTVGRHLVRIAVKNAATSERGSGVKRKPTVKQEHR